jgi:3alpha(or 20beta)-hydroxysteroid dehydrogenase
MNNEARLAGKVALITGGARGIGEAIARTFAQHGAAVVIGDIRTELGEVTARDIGGRARFKRLDVCDVASWEAVVAEIEAQFGGLDILVNNAGGGAGGGIERETMEEHRRVVDLNLTGVWSGVRAVVRPMSARGNGSIINISSIDGLVGVAGLSTYVATKHAVTGMTRALALELGERGIRVNSIHPGIIETPLVKATAPKVMERLRNAVARQPIKRMGRPEEVAAAALFFASDESSYCTGSALVVDGGHIAGPYRDPL